MDDPGTLAVHWGTRHERVDHAANTGGEVQGPSNRLDDLISAYLGLRHRRLVMLGAAGAGKTTLAVLLSLALIRRRQADSPEPDLPVPVMLSLASWDPDREHFATWFTRRIADDYPGLPRIDGRHPARDLWSGGYLVPVLDGLDEMPTERMPAAVSALNRGLRSGDPLIVTCRSREFDSLPHHYVVRSAAAIEAQPVPAEDACRDLHAGAAPLDMPRWEPLLGAVRASPDSAVAAAFSTPFMLWLARRVYARPSSRPEELLQTPRFPTRQAVEEHLLDAVIPAVFSGELPSYDRWEPPRRWSADRARRALRYLARHLGRRDTPDLAWWELYQTVPLVACVGAALVLVALLMSEAVQWLTAARVAQAEGIARPQLASMGMTNALGVGLLHGIAIQITIRTWFGSRFGEPRRKASLARPGAALRSALHSMTTSRAVLVPLVLVALQGTLVVVTLVGVLPGPQVLLLVLSLFVGAALTLMFSAPAVTDQEVLTPSALLSGERRSVLLAVVLVGPIVAAGAGLPSGGLAGVVIAWIGVTAMLVPVSPWFRWVCARTCLAVAGCTPFRWSVSCGTVTVRDCSGWSAASTSSATPDSGSVRRILSPRARSVSASHHSCRPTATCTPSTVHESADGRALDLETSGDATPVAKAAAFLRSLPRLTQSGARTTRWVVPANGTLRPVSRPTAGAVCLPVPSGCCPYSRCCATPRPCGCTPPKQRRGRPRPPCGRWSCRGCG